MHLMCMQSANGFFKYIQVLVVDFSKIFDIIIRL